jgi:nitroreductase
MDVFEAVERRHSYRGEFRNVAVPREDLRRIVEAGIRAPSGHNLQSTSFAIVDDANLIQEIAKCTENKVIAGARALIVCLSKRIPSPSGSGLVYDVEDCAAATENMLLATTALGYATCWIDGALRRANRAARIGELLCVPEGLTVRVILPIGAPAKTGRQKEKEPFEKRAFFNCWKEPQP